MCCDVDELQKPVEDPQRFLGESRDSTEEEPLQVYSSTLLSTTNLQRFYTAR